MIKYLILAGLLAVTAPFWLPTSLGGDTSYHFVSSDSMKGTVDTGSLVVLRRADTYQVGDVVTFQQGGAGDSLTILHRIIRRLPDGRFLIKGDAVTPVDEVAEELVQGRMVLAVPALGFLPGAFRQAPYLLGGLLLASLLLTGGLQDRGAKGVRRGRSLFLPAALLVLVSIPYSSRSLGDLLPFAPGEVAKLLDLWPLPAWLVGLVGVTRLGEITRQGPNAALFVEVNYVVVMVLSVLFLPIPDLVKSARMVMAL